MNLLDKFLLCPPIWIIRITAASILSLFSIYTAFFGVFPDMIQRSFHIGIILFLVYLFPLQNLSYNDLLRSFKSYLFMILSLLSLLVMLYQITFFDAINEALVTSMKKNRNVLLIGLGVDDPKGIFGTTRGINKIFKKDRVFDFPTAENAMTGIAIGSSLIGMRPVITHQRVEFSLLAMEQIINQAAKWFFMNAGQKSVPLVIRLRTWRKRTEHSSQMTGPYTK